LVNLAPHIRADFNIAATTMEFDMRCSLPLVALTLAASSPAATPATPSYTPILNHKIEMARAIRDDKNAEVGRLLDSVYLKAADRFEQEAQPLLKEVGFAVGHSFLTLAVKSGSIASFDELLRRGANVHDNYVFIRQQGAYKSIIGPVEFSLAHALSSGQHHFLDKLLEAGVNPSFELAEGIRPAHYTARRCDSSSAARAMARLRYHHADLNLRSEHPRGDGTVALHLVAMGRNNYCLDVLAVMLKTGTDVDRKDPNGVFLDADVSLRDARGLRAIDYANVKPNCDIEPRAVLVRRQMVSMLLKAGSAAPSIPEYCTYGLRPPP
jgi:hypothetical protein